MASEVPQEACNLPGSCRAASRKLQLLSIQVHLSKFYNLRFMVQ
jgi:hypothetical protein